VAYGFGILALEREPVVIQVPDFGDRFWVYQLGDQRTDGFANLGQMYGSKPGCYLLVGPDWQGSAPEGIQAVFRSPTNVGVVIPRVFMDDTAADRQAILALVGQIMAYPLSQFTGQLQTKDWTPAPGPGRAAHHLCPAATAPGPGTVELATGIRRRVHPVPARLLARGRHRRRQLDTPTRVGSLTGHRGVHPWVGGRIP